MAILRELYGSGVEKVIITFYTVKNYNNQKLKVEHTNIKVPNKSTSIELVTVASNYHIEMNPSDSGRSDRIVVQEVIKKIAQSHPIDATTQRSFKVVVLNEVDKLSRDAQHALRRTMEKYMSSCRIILCCNSTSKVIDPLRSRCLAIRVPAPNQQEIITVLQSISKKEGITLPIELAKRIADLSDRNLRKAILMLESSKVKQYPFQVDQVIEKPDWEEFLIQLAREIAEEQSPKRLLSVRSKLYELLSHCIPPEIIIRNLALQLLSKLDSELKYEVIKWAAYYEHRLQTGSKPIFHLEAFVAKFMSIYKRFLITLEGY